MGQIQVLNLFANHVGLTLGDCLVVRQTCYVATSHLQTTGHHGNGNLWSARVTLISPSFHRETENWKNELNFLKLYFLGWWDKLISDILGGVFFFYFCRCLMKRISGKIENQQVLVSGFTLGCLSFWAPTSSHVLLAGAGSLSRASSHQ